MKAKRPLEEMLPIAEAFVHELVSEGACVRAEVAGSVRRRRPECGDIEIVAIPRFGEYQVSIGTGDLFLPGVQAEVKLYNALWSYLDDQAERGRIRYSKRGDKYRQFALDGAPVDLFTATQENWGSILLIRTGDADFSKKVIGHLLPKHGYRHQEGHVTKDGCLVPVPEEEDVFRLIGRPFVPPSHRTGKSL